MVKKSKGSRSRTRSLLRRRAREKTTITKCLQEFKIGSRVTINLDPSSHKGRPFNRFQGKVGTVINKRGRSYIIGIKDGKKEKEIISAPRHLEVV